MLRCDHSRWRGLVLATLFIAVGCDEEPGSGLPRDSGRGADSGKTDTGPLDPQDAGDGDSGLVVDAGKPMDGGNLDAETRDSGDVDSGSVDTGIVDSGPADIGFVDAGRVDTGLIDTGPVDTGIVDTGIVDTGPLDTGIVDTGPVDTGPIDTGPVDTGPVDTGIVDTGPVDTGPIDTGIFDTGIFDTGIFDTGIVDSGPVDAGTPDAGTVACTNGGGRVLWRLTFPNNSGGYARVEEWEAACQYSLADQACSLSGEPHTYANWGPGVLFNSSRDYFRVRFSVAGMQFSSAQLYISAHAEGGGIPNMVLESQLHGGLQFPPSVPSSGHRTYVVDWSTFLLPNDQPSLTAVTLRSNPTGFAVSEIELCVQ